MSRRLPGPGDGPEAAVSAQAGASGSGPARKRGDPRHGPPRHGFWAWFLFIAAVAAVLSVTGGCMAMMYAPVFGGG